MNGPIAKRNFLMKAGLIFLIFGILDFLMLLLAILFSFGGQPYPYRPMPEWAAVLETALLGILFFWWVFLFVGGVLIVVGTVVRDRARSRALSHLLQTTFFSTQKKAFETLL